MNSSSSIRLLPIWVGTSAGFLLLINRFLTPELTNSQSRSDVLGVILSAVLILIGLLWQAIQPKIPESVELDGFEGMELYSELPESTKIELAWASHILLTNTVTKTLVVYYQDKLILRRGILSGKSEVTVGPILERVMETSRPVYLVSLALYPGRFEFDYLPTNTQGVICQPLGNEGVMILGSNAPRSYTKQDENWITGIAEKLNNSLKFS